MATYKEKFRITFKNLQEDNYRIDILEKDYTGAITTLQGAMPAFTVKYSLDERPPQPIFATNAEINFFSTEFVNLESFYSEDDEQFRVDFYCDVANGVSITKILWRGYVVQDDCSEDLQDAPQVVTLTATDNIGLLKDVSYDTAFDNSKTTYLSGVSDITVEDFATLHLDLPVEITEVDIKPYDLFFWRNRYWFIFTHDFTAPTLTLILQPSIPYYADTYPDEEWIIYKTHTTSPLLGKTTLLEYLEVALIATGIQLPLRIYANIYENTQQDRDDVDTAEFLSQTRLFSGMFLSDDNAWDDCYTIIEKILKPLNATLLQAEGYWNVIRFPEAVLFYNEIPGTEYDENFENPVSITLDPNFLIEYHEPGIPKEHEFIGGNSIRRIARPFKFCFETFNYRQPTELIQGLDLQTFGNFTGSTTVGDLRYDHYQVNSTWKHEDSAPNGNTPDSSYIEIVVDTTTDTETDRYIVDPNETDEHKWLQLTPIEVSKDDYFDFSYQYKSRNDTNGTVLRIHTRFLLFTPDGDCYSLIDFTSGSETFLIWSHLGTDDFYKVDLGISTDIPDSADHTEWATFSLSSILENTKRKLPPIPVDGVLIVGLDGSNDSTNNGSLEKEDVFMKDFNLTFYNRINESLNIVGQSHNTKQNDNIKNNFDEEIEVDDSPRNTVAGTLFTNELTTTFSPNIGQIYFTKTNKWHRKNFDESMRLGEIITYEQKLMSIRPRTIVEGEFTFIRYEQNGITRFVSPMNVIQILSLASRNFIMSMTDINYSESRCNSTMYELYSDEDITGSDEIAGTSYEFKYLFKTT